MPRRNNYSGKYKLTKAEYLSAKYYALRYKDWCAEYNEKCDTVGSLAPDGMPHNKVSGDPTLKLAIRREELQQKIELIEQTAIEADLELYPFIIKKACFGNSYEKMNMQGELYVSRATFFRKLRKFYYLLAGKI